MSLSLPFAKGCIIFQVAACVSAICMLLPVACPWGDTQASRGTFRLMRKALHLVEQEMGQRLSCTYPFPSGKGLQCLAHRCGEAFVRCSPAALPRCPADKLRAYLVPHVLRLLHCLLQTSGSPLWTFPMRAQPAAATCVRGVISWSRLPSAMH